MPPELKAKKSVIIPRVDDLIYEQPALDIGEEIAKKNQWIGDELGVYKFPCSPAIKLTFSQTILDKMCIEIGLKAFSVSIPPHEIKLETYISIQCCMRCYALEHFKNECPKNNDFKVCSECSTVGHVWHQYKEENKKKLSELRWKSHHPSNEIH